MKPRQVVLIDPENLVGSGKLTPESLLPVTDRVTQLLPIDPEDIVFVGGDSQNAFALSDMAKSLSGTCVWGRGKDGAEIALEAAFNSIPKSAWDNPDFPITRVVICSGDHYFVPTAIDTRRHGRSVVTISRQMALSHELASASDLCLIYK